MRRLCLCLVGALVLVAGPGVVRASGGAARYGRSLGRITAHWEEITPTGAELPSGAVITSVVELDGRFVAAGDYFGGDHELSGGHSCTSGCNPVVWTSRKGGRWSVALSEPAQGSTAGERLVVTAVGLFLLADDEGTTMWRSTIGLSWARSHLPVAMEALDVAGVAWGDGRLVAVMSNKYAGSADTGYGRADTIWSSVDGRTWHQDHAPGSPGFSSLTFSSGEFLAGGVSRSSGKPGIWASRDGLTWRMFPLDAPRGTVSVYGEHHRFVVDDAVGTGTASAKAYLLCSDDGVNWSAAAGQQRGAPVVNDGPSSVMATSAGFVGWDTLTGRFSLSSTGCAWHPMAASGAPARRTKEVEALFPDSHGLLAAVTSKLPGNGATAGSTSFWQVTLPLA